MPRKKNEETIETTETTEATENAETTAKRSHGYSNPQPRLHPEKFPNNEVAICAMTTAEIHGGQLFLGRKSVGRAAVETLGRDLTEIPVFTTDLSSDEVKEIEHYSRPFQSFWPQFEGDAPAPGSIIGIEIGDKVYVGVLVANYEATMNTALAVPVSDNVSELPFVPGSPEKVTGGTVKVAPAIKKMLDAGIDAKTVADILGVDLAKVEAVSNMVASSEEE